MEQPRDKIRSKILIISVSIILFFISNGRLNKSSDWLGGVFYIEVTDLFILVLITIYLYYSVRFIVLRKKDEFKNLFNRVLKYRNKNKIYLLLVERRLRKQIDKLTPIDSTLDGEEKDKFTGDDMSIDRNDDIKLYHLRNIIDKDEFIFQVSFINQTKNKVGTFEVKLSKFFHYLFVPLSIPKYLFDDYFYDVILPYITMIISWGIILSYLLGFQELIIQEELL